MREALRQFLAWDAEWSARLRVAEKPGLLRRLAGLLARSGDSWFWLLAIGLFWLFGGPEWRWRALVMGVAVICGAAVVLAIKFTVRRQRPAGEWGAIYRSTDPHSFPSGHAARAFLLLVLAFGLGPAWLAWVLVVWSPLVALARVAMGVHYLSDVLAGALVGLALGWAALLILP